MKYVTAHLGCSKTQISLEVWQPPNLHQEAYCVFSEARPLCPFHGHARNRLQCHTAAQKLKWYHWTLVWDRKDCLLSHSGILWLTSKNPLVPIRPARGDPSRQFKPKTFRNPLIISQLTHQNPAIVPKCFFTDNDAVINMIIKGPQPAHTSCF